MSIEVLFVTKNTNHLGVMEEKALLLIVDDMPSNLRVLNTCLAQDYHVAMAHDGESALEIAQKKHPTLILLDIMMPGLDGFGCGSFRTTLSD
ncbi:response regulator [Thiorhodovibrio frisius]|uniref:response regulator n=1 Tax=Thiorhodovibrio frisius TaxID=631362 RepID=UPI000255E2E4|nr:response regulator [Thiorhodovibrio frisius]